MITIDTWDIDSNIYGDIKSAIDHVQKGVPLPDHILMPVSDGNLFIAACKKKYGVEPWHEIVTFEDDPEHPMMRIGKVLAYPDPDRLPGG